MKRAYFQYYETFEKVVKKFKTEEEQNAFRSKIIAYGLYGNEPETLNEKEAIAWVFIKDLIDDQVHRREVQAANRAKRTTATAEPEEAEPEEKPKRKKAEPFTPPTVEEVDAYCRERNNGITGLQFVDYYSRLKDPAWTIGNQKKPMKDWKAAVRQWESRRKTETRGTIANDRVAPGAAFSCNKYK